MDGLAELDALQCELEQAHRRVGGLARSDDRTLRIFGKKAYGSLNRLIRMTIRAGSDLEQLEIRARAERAYEEEHVPN